MNKKKIAWNKGLTKETDKRVRKNAESLEGHEVSFETIKKISNTLSKKIPIGTIICNKCGKGFRNYIKIRSAISDGKNNFMSYPRYLIEKEIGRKLSSNEIVHHINEITNDDRIENLQLMTIQEHVSHHKTKLKGGEQQNE